LYDKIFFNFVDQLNHIFFPFEIVFLQKGLHLLVYWHIRNTNNAHGLKK